MLERSSVPTTPQQATGPQITSVISKHQLPFTHIYLHVATFRVDAVSIWKAG